MFIGVDFDGTIVDYRFPEIGKPAPGALAWLKRWEELGGRIILFTMRSGQTLEAAVDFLRGKDIQLYGINRNPEQDSWTSSPKAFAHVYVDDAAFGCPLTHPRGFTHPCVDWTVVGPEVANMLLGDKLRQEGSIPSN